MVRFRAVLGRLFTILSAMSLVLCVATCALWARSSEHMDAMVIDWCGTTEFDSMRGTAWLTTEKNETPSNHMRIELIHDGLYPPLYLDAEQRHAELQHPGLAHFGFYCVKLHVREVCGLGVPFWLLIIMSTALPLLRARRSRTGRKRRTNSACSTCGYDLLATPGRCPECGTIFPKGGAK